MKYTNRTPSFVIIAALTAWLAASLSPELLAQTEERPSLPVAITGFAGVTMNLHSVDFSIIPGFGGYGENFSSGSGFGFAFGGGAEYFPKASFFGMPYRVGGLLMFSTFSGSLVKQDFIGNVIQGNSVSKGLVETSVDASISAVLAEPYFIFNPFEGTPFSIKVGLQAGIPLSASITRREELIAPEGVNFETGTRVRNNKTGDIPGKSSLLMTALGGFCYDIPLTTTLTLAPEVTFGYALTDVSSSLPWKANTLRAGMNVSYRLPEPLPEAPPPPPPPPRIQRLEIATILRVNGEPRTNGDKIAVPMKETRTTTRLTAAPVVFFAPNSDILFTPTAQNPALRSQQSVITTLAAYLRANPSAKLKITTFFADDEAPAIATRRAEAVIAALRRENVETKNITIVNGEPSLKMRRPELRDELRRVSFSINGSQMVLSTVETTTVVEGDDITISAAPEFEATELPITLGGTIDLNEQKLTTLGQTPSDYKIGVSEFANTSAPKNLTVHYDITDVSGSTKTAAIQVQLQPVTTLAKETVNADEQAKFEQHILGYFDFDAATFSAVDTFAVERAKQAIRDGKKVEIIGLTDDRGTEEYNSNLSQMRMSAGIALIGATINQVAATQFAQVFPNDATPASRALNRSVVVRIW